MAFGLSAGAVSLIGMGAGALLGGGGGGAQQTGTATSTQQQQLDPRIASILFGNPASQGQYDPETRTWSGGTPGGGGLLSRYQGYLDTPQNPNLAQYGQTAGSYLGANGATDLNGMRTAAQQLMSGNTQAPQMTPAHQDVAGMYGASMDPALTKATGYTASGVNMPQGMSAAQISAPSQNGLDLSGSYDRFVNGNPGANPYLTGAIQQGIDQSNNAFTNMQTNATDNLVRNILPSIRGGAVIAGGYGGSRQGIAEGNAVGDFLKAQQQGISQFGQNNTDAAVGAQSGSFNQGEDRALSATTGLGAQQYGVAGQDAGFKQAANTTNYGGALTGALADQSADNQAKATTAGYQNAADMANAAATNAARTTTGNWTQDANKTNANAYNTAYGNDAGFQQGAGTNNLQSWLSTNGLNSQNRVAGIGATGGLLGNAYGVAGSQDMYPITRAGAVNGLLAPYVGLNGSSTSSQPVYQNQGANILGGALAGSQLFRGSGGGYQYNTGAGNNVWGSQSGGPNAAYAGNDFFNPVNYAG